MQQVDEWFDTLIQRGDLEEDEAYWRRVKNSMKAKLIESYRSGKAAALESQLSVGVRVVFLMARFLFPARTQAI
jgi:hypothetical protein